MKKLLLILILILMGLVSVNNAFALPVQWSVNQNWYELVPAYTAAITWSTANQNANASVYNGMQGHLATITSAEENQFIQTLGPDMAFFGGYKTGSNWAWVTGEAWGYTNWNWDSNGYNPSGDGPALEFWGWKPTGTWNDLPATLGRNEYLVEYEHVATPEPASMALLGMGLFGLLGFRKKKQ